MRDFSLIFVLPTSQISADGLHVIVKMFRVGFADGADFLDNRVFPTFHFGSP